MTDKISINIQSSIGDCLLTLWVVNTASGEYLRTVRLTNSYGSMSHVLPNNLSHKELFMAIEEAHCLLNLCNSNDHMSLPVIFRDLLAVFSTDEA